MSQTENLNYSVLHGMMGDVGRRHSSCLNQTWCILISAEKEKPVDDPPFNCGCEIQPHVHCAVLKIKG